MISVRHALDAAWQHYCRGDWPQAEQLYLQVLQADPAQVDALQLLGAIAGQTGRDGLAVHYLQAVLRLQPGSAAAHTNLGNVFINQQNFPEALACFQRAVQLQPDLAIAHNNLGNALREMGRPAEAVASLRQALLLKPDAAQTHSALVVTLHYDPRSDARMIQEECARWNRRHAEPLRRFIQPHLNPPDPDRRLRIGYVSPDFCEHVDSFFLVPLLSNHDHERFEVVCYAGVLRPDGVTERLRGCADAWRSTAGMSDEQLADLVRNDQIDILVDLELHLTGDRLLTFARKPAPVQVTWLGYPGTTGLSTIDYRLTDPYLDPPGLFDEFYSEESVRLPDTFWCYDPLTHEPAVNALPALESGVVTFGCLNSFSKVNDDCLVLWARALYAVPESRLLMMAPAGEARAHVTAVLEERGIAPSRVEFLDRQPRSDYLRLYHRIDVALDPLPCNGHTTSLDGFWMGVPTVTLLGKTVVGRAGWSQLCNLGLQDLAAETPEGFVASAVSLAGDLGRLQELRGSLRQRMERSPLMDGKRFAGHMEQAYRHMWQRRCDDQQRRGSG